MKPVMLSICMLIGAAFLNHAATAAETPTVSQADYSAALRKISAETRRKPMAVSRGKSSTWSMPLRRRSEGRAESLK